MMKSACTLLKKVRLELLLLGAMQPAFAASTVTATNIEMLVEEDNLQSITTQVSAVQLAERVRANLQEWQFPLTGNGPYQYRLVAQVGKVAKGETPVGFSFSSGNSDPRAVDFQKAVVLPIHCKLVSADSAALLSQRQSTFSAEPLTHAAATAAVVDKLVDQISTVCLDTLEHTDLPKTTPRLKAAIFKPKWMPDVRVEMMEQPATDNEKLGGKVNAADEEVKKSVIIHNQGTPLILNLGHERR